jgi:D-alanyl-D-alanine carboxypeptidase/D-alanyl-D-alanine-endopeptidase (penicillin-binding protein 4)
MAFILKIFLTLWVALQGASLRVVILLFLTFSIWIEEAPSALAEPKTLASTTSSAQFTKKMKALIQSRIRKGDQVGVRVVRLRDGEVLYKESEHKALIPASATKLVTTAVALRVLGPGWKFQTRVHYAHTDLEELDRTKENSKKSRKPTKESSKKHHLFIQGGGDPFLVTERLELLASETVRALQAKGISKLDGDLIVVSGYFDEKLRGGGRGGRISDESYNASITDLALNYNSIAFEVHPADKKGERPKVFAVPESSNYMRIVNRAKTVRGSGVSLQIDRLAVGSDRKAKEGYWVKGSIGENADPKTIYRRLDKPRLYFLYVFREMLRRKGVEHSGGLKVIRAQNLEKSVDGLKNLVTFKSQPLADLVNGVNRYSNNFMAEQILKALGAEKKGTPGSFQKGVQVIDEELKKLGAKEKEYHLVNGSGLTDQNRLSAYVLNRVLETSWRDFSFFPGLFSSLATGSLFGTLRDRFKDLDRFGLKGSWVRAKTGTLFNGNSVSSLSGYTLSQQNEPIAFTIMMNRLGSSRVANIHRFRRAQDDMVKLMMTLN